MANLHLDKASAETEAAVLSNRLTTQGESGGGGSLDHTHLYIGVCRGGGCSRLKQADHPAQLLRRVLGMLHVCNLGPMLCMLCQPGVQVAERSPLVQLIGIADAQRQQDLPRKQFGIA